MTFPKPKNSKECRLFSFFYMTLLMLCVRFFPLYAQNNNSIAEMLANQLQNNTKNQSPDLVYLQTSKSIYETEEDLWFKGYVLDAQYFHPSVRSKTLFVQLIADKTDQVVWEKKYEIENGFVDGHLFLKSELEEGTYTLAAYSSNSFDKGSKEFYAAKKLDIKKEISTKAVVIPIEKDSILHFATFPEGGKLVSGIESTLAFKAVNSKGLPVIVSGTLFENDIPLHPITVNHAGMGSFNFTPDVNKKYHVKLTGLDKIHEIAPITASGKVLHLIGNDEDVVRFKVTQTDALKEEKVYLRLQVRGVVYSIAMGLLKKELVFKIPLNEVPQGIAEVTLFDEKLEPVAERLVFVNQEQKLTIKTELNQIDFTTRDKANLKIKVTDKAGKPIMAHLGLSVYEGLYQNKGDTKNIQSHYLLSTQLKGNVYNPAYYFNMQNEDRKQALDLLMLTQGWRNYVWNESNQKEKEVNNPIVFEELKGNVRWPKKKVKDPIVIKGLLVSTADEKMNKYFIFTDSTGVFTVGSSELKSGEGGYVYLELKTPSYPKYLVNFTNDFFGGINKYRKDKKLLYPISALPKVKTEAVSPFTGRASITKLKEVTITLKKHKSFRDKYIGKLDSLAGRLSNYTCHNGILNCQNHPQPRIRLSSQLTEEELLEMFNVVMIEGYYGKKVFYEAVYDEVTLSDSLPDFRNTLFCKSDVITDEKGEASVDFFCSDINSLFIGNIEGVNSDGLLGAHNFEFKVKKKAN